MEKIQFEMEVSQDTPLNEVIKGLWGSVFRLITTHDAGKAVIIIGFDERNYNGVSIGMAGKRDQLLMALAELIKNDSQGEGLLKEAYRLEAKRIIKETGVKPTPEYIKTVIEELLLK